MLYGAAGAARGRFSGAELQPPSHSKKKEKCQHIWVIQVQSKARKNRKNEVYVCSVCSLFMFLCSPRFHFHQMMSATKDDICRKKDSFKGA